MESGILMRWGEPKAGRERESMELYREAVGFYHRRVEEGKLTYFEPFMLASGDTTLEAGFFILRGPVTEIFSLVDSQEHRALLMRAGLLLEHFRIDMLTVGEAIDRNMADFQKALTSVGS